MPVPTYVRIYPTLRSNPFLKRLLTYRSARITRAFFHPLLSHTLITAVASITPCLPYGGLCGSRWLRLHRLLQRASRDSHNRLLDNIRR